MTMRIMITGNMGYIGPVVTKHLRKTLPQAELIGLDSGFFGNCISSVNILPECLMDRQLFKDIRTIDCETFADVDAVVHLAGISNDPIGNKFEEVTLAINHKATIEAAKAAKKAGVKSFVFASSCSMYGEAEGKPKTEKDELNPLTAYAKSKVFSERDLKPLADDQFKVTCLRFSTACGMSDRLRLDLVLNDFVACAVTSGRIAILSDGTPWRPLINVKDMARAIEWAIARDSQEGGQFLAVNVGSDEWNYQVKQLAEAVMKIIPRVEIDINKNAAPDKRSYKVNFALFRELAPKHQPQVDLDTSIEELKEGLERMNFNDANFRSSNYMRLMHLTQLMDNGLLDSNLNMKKA